MQFGIWSLATKIINKSLIHVKFQTHRFEYLPEIQKARFKMNIIIWSRKPRPKLPQNMKIKIGWITKAEIFSRLKILP